MQRYVVVQKAEGETPLGALERYRALHTELIDVPMTYAGRLDPMATGALILLIGDECKKRDAYTSLDKEYEFSVLFGVGTDTGDVLGIMCDARSHMPGAASFAGAIHSGTRILPYPVFSSKTVRGIPLFEYALRGELDTIEIPKTEMTVCSISFVDSQEVKAADVRDGVARRLETIHESAVNDFRIDSVRASWKTLPDGTYTIARYRAVVSSGTYIRALAQEAGKTLGIPALAYTIHRTHIVIKK